MTTHASPTIASRRQPGITLRGWTWIGAAVFCLAFWVMAWRLLA